MSNTVRVSWKQLHEEIRKDVEYIETTYNQVDDFCGGWCNNDQMNRLLKSPTYKTCVMVYISMLERYFYVGYANPDANKLGKCGFVPELPVKTDTRLQQIKERWRI